jgi:hypothetical protein
VVTLQAECHTIVTSKFIANLLKEMALLYTDLTHFFGYHHYLLAANVAIKCQAGKFIVQQIAGFSCLVQ